jgi:DNA replication protein DnaC
MALVRYRANDYSVPVEWGHREVLVKGFVHEVVICAASEVIARHPRSYEREDMIFDPLHYLALLEQKPNALDQAAPLAGWDLPEGFAQLRRLMEARLGKKGKREYVQTLRLLETFALPEVARAIDDALRLGAISFDAVKHLLLCRIKQRAGAAGSGELSAPASSAGGHHRGRSLPGSVGGLLMDTPQVLLDHHLKTLRLPTFLREYDKVAQECAAEGVDSPRYLLRLSELELLDRERRATERRIRQAEFDVVKSLDTFDFLAIPSLNKALVLDLARCEFIERKENVLALGNSGTGKTHIALALRLAACQKAFRVRFTTAASLAHELIEAKDERRLMRFQQMLSSFELLIIDELGFVPLSKTGAELLFEVFSRRYERSSTLVTSNLPFNEWTEAFGSERLTGALLDRLTHHVHILEMNGDSYRLKDSKRKRPPKPRSNCPGSIPAPN